jgi:PEP-CTERM motif
MFSRFAATVVISVILALLSISATRSQVTVIDSDTFKFIPSNPGRFPNANNFELTIGGRFVGVPASNVFPNRSITSNDPRGMAMFSGNTIPNPMNMNGEVNISFQSNAVRNAPAGFFTFTNAMGTTNQVSGVAYSKALDGTRVVFSPMGPGFDALLTLANDTQYDLTGSFTAYVNNGFSEGLFNLNDFATLRDATPIETDSNFTLSPGQAVPDIIAQLQSIDQYILVVGEVDNGDGDGLSPFSLAFSPTTAIVPEPSTTMLLATAVLFLGWRWRVRYRSFTPRSFGL